MRRRILCAAVAALIVFVSNSTVLAKPSGQPDKPLPPPANPFATRMGAEETVIVTIPQTSSAPGEVTTLSTYPVECTLAISVAETSNIMGDPGILGRVTVVSCTQAGVTLSGTLAVEYQNRYNNSWNFPSGGSGSRVVGVGGTIEMFYRHNSYMDMGWWRTHFWGTATCANCTPTPFNAQNSSGTYTWSAVFFYDWYNFDTLHYQKHKYEWSPVPSKLQYLNKSRDAATYAQSVEMGAIYDPTYYAGIRGSDGTLIGMNTNNGEIVFLHQPGQTYPYLGSFFVHNPAVSGCKTHKDYFYKVTYGYACP